MITLEDSIPGFGGFWYDSLGNMRVILTDTAHIDKARAILMPRLKARPRGFSVRPGRPVPSGEPQVIAQPGRFTYSRLFAWKRTIEEVGLGNGVTMVGILQRRNQVTVGVLRSDLLDSVRRLVLAAGVPADAFHVIVSNSRPAATLSSYRDSLEGGIKIEGDIGEYHHDCAIGFNAKYGSVRVFVTNSHCTSQRGGINGTTFYQPSLTSGRIIATEYYDPPWETNATNSDCPVSKKCRYSDAALALYVNGAIANLNTIARPEWAGLELEAGSTQINASNPHWEVIGVWPEPSEGDMVHKVGPVSGWTAGEVLHTCASWPVLSNDGSYETEFRLLCQMTTEDARLDPGDSGSPVFLFSTGEDPNFDQVYIAGVAHSVSGYGYADEVGLVFSSYFYVESELGWLEPYAY